MNQLIILLRQHPNRQKPNLFLDLDGTVRKGLEELGRFVNGPEDVDVYEPVRKSLIHYQETHNVIGVTNQLGIALGHTTAEKVIAAAIETDRQCQNAFNAILIAPADDQYRKPNPGMLLHFGITPNDLMIGDRVEDILVARNAKVEFKGALEWRNELL